MWIRLSYQTSETPKWIFGKTWILYALEGGELEFITDWMQINKKTWLPTKEP